MNPPHTGPWTRFRGAGLLTAVAVALWRTCSVSPASWWRDWILVAALYWAYSCVKGGSEVWGRVTVSVMAYLFGLYAMGQWPHTLAALGGSP